MMNAIEGKNILVTGATGLIGFNLVEKIMQMKPSMVIVTGRNEKKLAVTFEHYLGLSNFMILQHDATSPIPTDIGYVDYIFHAAGPMEREIVMNRPVDVILPNVVGLISLLDYLKRQEIDSGRKGRLVVFSSVTVYNNIGNDDYDAKEDETIHAISLDAPSACYAESKRMVEVIARSYKKQFDIDVVIARFSTVYGPTRNIPDTAFFEFIRNSIQGKDIMINNSTIPRRDNIYVDDAVNGLLCVAVQGVSGDAYNISSGGEKGNYAAIDEIAKMVAVVADNGSTVRYKTEGGIRKGGMTLNNSKLKQLGWTLQYSMEAGIIATINKMKKIIEI